ncbi:MAG: hypothetical protein ACYTGX_12165 [Planctomycetota bacterium]
MRNPFVIALCAASLAVLTGCPSSDGPNPPATPAGEATTPKGEPLELNDTGPATSGTCAQCRQAAGPAHTCGTSEWCAACNADIAAGGADHVCNVSRFCKACGVEAAIAGHRCGETRFDKATLSPADVDEEEEE